MAIVFVSGGMLGALLCCAFLAKCDERSEQREMERRRLDVEMERARALAVAASRGYLGR